MPPKLRLRPRGPVHPPTSEIVVSQKHSFELVRTVITATISHVLWARKVFPHLTYNFRSCDPADPEVDYSVFMAGSKTKSLTFDPTDDLMIWKVLPRGKEPAVEKVLDCLEYGATDALQKGYLSKLQLSFHSMDDAPAGESNMIESYTMLFAYENGQDISVSTEIETNSLVLRSAKQQVYNLVNDVGFVIHYANKHRLEYQELPANFRMIMSLKYHDHTPPDYQPRMFHQGDENTVQTLRLGIPDNKLAVDTGFHKISIGVNILEVNDAASSNQLGTRIQSQRQREVSVSSDLDGAQTQPEAMRQIQTIGTFRDPDLGTQDTIRLQQNPNTQDVERQNSRTGLIDYTQQVIDRINAAKLFAPQDDLDLDEQQNTQRELSCECCALGDNESLVQCVICQEFKHVACYGYVHDYSPKGLVCYTCLLSDYDPERLEMQVKPLCTRRRALWYLRENGSLSSKTQEKEFALHLNIMPQLAAKLLNELKAAGYVSDQKKGNKTSSHVYTYTGDDERLRQNYFRPQQEIEDFFVEPRTSDVQEAGLEDELPSHRPESAVTASPDLYGASPILARRKFTETMETAPKTPFPQSTRYLLEGSSTQGTPSPLQKKPVHAMRQLAATNPMNTELKPLKFHGILSGTKRTADEGEAGTSSKRHKVGEVSPWFIHRGET